MSDDLASQVARFFWWHSIDLGQGIITPGGKSPALHEQESAAFFDRVNLTGCSVLDIGAWNGFYSFEAKRRGAGRVLATDSCCWTDNRVRGRETFDLARKALGADVEALEIDVADIKPETTGPFDVVMFLGVFYHRYDPIEALARAASVTKELLIIESHIDLQTLDRPAMVFYPGDELLGDASNWWGPNTLCLEALLRGHGFSEIEVAFHPQTQSRAVFHAWRSTRLRRSRLVAPLQLALDDAVPAARKQNSAGDSDPNRDQSQFGELAILLKKLNPEQRGILVDVGANSRQGSNSYNLLNQYRWRGLLVEANPALYPVIERDFAGLDFTLERSAVSDVAGELPFYLGVNDGISSLLVDQVKAWGDVTGETRVRAERLGDILHKHRIPHQFDLLSIDIEGMDALVLNDLIGSTPYRPRFIIAELSRDFAIRSLADLPLCRTIQDEYTIVGQTAPNLILGRTSDMLPVAPRIQETLKKALGWLGVRGHAIADSSNAPDSRRSVG
jgi:tRNA (mo5U34)-methyltransferase